VIKAKKYKQRMGCEAQLASQLYSLFISFAWWQHRFAGLYLSDFHWGVRV